MRLSYQRIEFRLIAKPKIERTLRTKAQRIDPEGNTLRANAHDRVVIFDYEVRGQNAKGARTVMAKTDSMNKVDHDEPATTGVSGEEMLVDVGGRRLYITCMGEGSPTVILEHGMATESDSWAQVQQAVAQFTRVCAFDRAGRGKSDPAPKPRTSEDMVADLHALLANAHIPGPYILVGNSLGGFNARLYAHKYPGEVVGLVLVDSMHPDQFARFERGSATGDAAGPGGLEVVQAILHAGLQGPDQEP